MSRDIDLAWVGPNHAMELREARRRGLKVYAENPAPKPPPRPKAKALPAPVAAPKQPAKPTGKGLPDKPPQSRLHPLQMGDRHAIRAEFNALIDWVERADAAPGEYSPREEIERDMIAERVDLLRVYAFG